MSHMGVTTLQKYTEILRFELCSDKLLEERRNVALKPQNSAQFVQSKTLWIYQKEYRCEVYISPAHKPYLETCVRSPPL